MTFVPNAATRARPGQQSRPSEVSGIICGRTCGCTHPLIAICAALLSAEINIHYAYPLLLHPHAPTLALYVDDPTLAAQILIRKGFKLIGESDLKGDGE